MKRDDQSRRWINFDKQRLDNDIATAAVKLDKTALELDTMLPQPSISDKFLLVLELLASSSVIYTTCDEATIMAYKVMTVSPAYMGLFRLIVDEATSFDLSLIHISEPTRPY